MHKVHPKIFELLDPLPVYVISRNLLELQYVCFLANLPPPTQGRLPLLMVHSFSFTFDKKVRLQYI